MKTQLVNIHYNPHVDLQGSSQLSYTLHLWDQPILNVRDRSPSLSTATSSPCTTPSSLNWSDSEPSPTQRQQTLDDVSSISLPSVRPFSPSIPETASSAGAQAEQGVEAPGPRRLSTASTKSLPPEPDSTAGPSREAVGRRTPKQRRTTRAVQSLACHFCRRRKIACVPSTNVGSGDRTCEYVVITTLSLKTLFCILSWFLARTVNTRNQYLCTHILVARFSSSISPLFFFPFFFSLGAHQC